MDSTIVLSLKCLLFSALVIAGCTIAETIDFNFDFSGTRTIEFQYRVEPEEGVNPQEYDHLLEGLSYIDSISQWVNNVSNLELDTSDYEMAKLSYDFTAAGLQIKDQEKYDYFMNKMPEEFRWYFNNRPTTFEVINDNQVLWKVLHQKIEELESKSLEELSEELSEVATATILNFDRKIKDIDPQSPDIIISADRKTIMSELKFDEVTGLKRANEVIITFE